MRKPIEARFRVEVVPKQKTIRDVARAAGVGIGTISRVLNSSSQVSRETRARVLEAIRRLGFRPNAQARRILKRRELLPLLPATTKSPTGFRDRCSGTE